MKQPFEASYAEIKRDLDHYIDVTFNSLQSSFLLLPRGDNFITYPTFQDAFEVLKASTKGFSDLSEEVIFAAFKKRPLSLVVLRAILGLSPPEWAHLASKQTEHSISQSFARGLDYDVRSGKNVFEAPSARKRERVLAMVRVACDLLKKGVGDVPDDVIHRLDKVDTRSGLSSLHHLVNEGAPYAVLLYERFLGRPFASHRDSVSELVGEVMENAVEDELRAHGISYRKTGRAEQVEGFDQAPDFIIPDEWNPKVVIEAKITEDDGTARDKVTRIQHLATISWKQKTEGKPGFQVVACIDGRGFGVRREDMRKLFEATHGKVFTTATLNRLVNFTALQEFKTKH